VLISCENVKDKNSLIDSNKIWFSEKMVDTEAEILDSSLNNKLIDKITSYLKTEKRQFLNSEYELMVNREGGVDQIAIQRSQYPIIDSIVIVSVKNWKFNAGTISGENVNSIYPLKLQIFANEPTIGIYEPDYLVTIENMPELIGGLEGLQSKIKYPEIAKRAGIEGKVYVLAFIDENGNVAGAKIIKGIGAGCDEAALDAVKQSKFTPGRQKGEPFKVQVAIPIIFKLQ